MKPTATPCANQRVADYLNEQLTDDQQREFEVHLVECSRCRAELDRLAADPLTWREAAEMLRPLTDDATNGLLPTPAVWAEDNGMPDPMSRPAGGPVTSVLDLLAPTDDPEMLGRLGEYEISGVIGIGGMGAVLKGFDRSLRRVVAIKVMAPHLAGSGPARARFQREARAAAAITHDTVIDIYGVAEANGLPYLVMPYAKGPSLQKRIDNEGPLGVTEVVRIARQTAAGLAAAHEQGLVHRDIKPANILLIHDGIDRLCITDFGVARAIDDASMTNTGLIAGTPQYMSPEQARGEPVDQRSDLFSLGSVLYTACTGRPPFRSESAYGILRRITDTEPRPIREINPQVPEWLCRIVARLMAKHPADRFENAQEVVDLMDICLAHMQRPADVPLPDTLVTPQIRQEATQTPSRFVRSIRRGVLAMFALLSVVASGGILLQATSAPAISGHWTGDPWSNVALVGNQHSPDWYSGTFTTPSGESGALQLRWSRVQQRFNGEWRTGDSMFGELSLRQTSSSQLRGAISIDPAAETSAEVPRLREFVWQPSTQPAAAARRNAKALPQESEDESERRQQGPPQAENVAATESDARPPAPHAAQPSDVGTLSGEATSLLQRLRESMLGGEQAPVPSLGLDITSVFGTASNLAQRLRELTEGVKNASRQLAQAEAAVEEAEKVLASWEEELRRAKENGESFEQIQAIQQALRSAEREPAHRKAARDKIADQLAFVQSQLADAHAERDTILKVLGTHHDLALRNLNSAEQMSRMADQQYDAGDIPMTSVLEARQEYDRFKAEAATLKMLIDFYQGMAANVDNAETPRP